MKILFLSRSNTARSQIAEGLARQMMGSQVPIVSAGIERSDGREIHPLAVEVMKEINIDISNQQVSQLQDVDLSEFDLTVVICEQNLLDGRENVPRLMH